jgi:hypothetical protein
MKGSIAFTVLVFSLYLVLFTMSHTRADVIISRSILLSLVILVVISGVYGQNPKVAMGTSLTMFALILYLSIYLWNTHRWIDVLKGKVQDLQEAVQRGDAQEVEMGLDKDMETVSLS